MRVHTTVIKLLLTSALAALALATAGAAAAGGGGSTEPPMSGGAGFAGAGAGKPKHGRYIVVLRRGAQVDDVVRRHDRLPGVKILLTYRHAVRGYAAELSKRSLADIRRDRRVRYVVADRPLRLSEQTTPTGVQRIGARDVDPPATAVRSALRDVGVAVLDTGIDLDHPDLGTVVPAMNCTAEGLLADDDNGHGTHVAGTIAALDNDVGVVGVAPGVTLYAVKIFDSKGHGTWATALCGIDWVAAHSALVGVANLSFVGRGYVTPSLPGCANGNSDVLHTAVCAATTAGVTVVAAAGNDKADAGSYVPAAYEEAIAVSALSDTDGAPGAAGPPSCSPFETDDAFATFSNHGAVIDIAAPGVCIESTFKNGGYRIMSGTSMAAPHVTGAVALLLQANPALTPEQVRAQLLSAQEPGPIPGDPDTFAEGVVHATAGTDLTGVSPPAVGTVAVPAAPPVPAIPAAPAAPAQPAVPAAPPGGLPPIPAPLVPAPPELGLGLAPPI